MKTRKLNVFILNENPETAGKLRRYLRKKFGNALSISLFFNSAMCLNRLNGHADMVVIDDYLYQYGSHGMSSLEVLKKIKDKSPSTEVVILTSDEDVGLAVEAMRIGAKDYILNKLGSWQRLQHLLDKAIQQPINYLIAEFGVPKFVGIFLITFAGMGIIVGLTIRYLSMY
jgi:DNA-binding NtrC family response regulator